MDADYVRDSLLKYNYFPRHRTKSAEMPPFFDTTSLNSQAAAGITAAAPYPGKSKGCDFVPYTLTRFNGGPRLCGLPHPYSYCRLVETIHKNWTSIEAALESNSSQIQAEPHKDGRIFIMDYESQFSRSKAYLAKQSCKLYVAKTDISHFYPSIYTHSVPWAIVGVEDAKKNTKANLWYNKLDARIRDCKRAETNGILVGPGASSLVAEIILATIDRVLERRNFSFLRFIDDYTCFCETREEASRFIDELEKQLDKYSLYLNFAKTYVEPLQGSELPEWISLLECDRLGESPNFFALKMFFSRAVALAEKYPTGSVLRYAVHALQGKKLGQQSGEYALRTILSLSIQNLHLVSALSDFIKYGLRNNVFVYYDELDAVLKAAVSRRRSDAICWALYLFKINNLTVPYVNAQAIMKTYDPCALSLLYEVSDPNGRRSITNYVKKSILSRDHSVVERNWFLVHYLLNTGKIKVGDVKDNTLIFMRNSSLNLFIQ